MPKLNPNLNPWSQLIPKPHLMRPGDGGFRIPQFCLVYANPLLGDLAPLLRANLQEGLLNFHFQFVPDVKAAVIEVRLDAQVREHDGYILNVSNSGIRISVQNVAGIILALQSLRQVLQAVLHTDRMISAAVITDFPSFSWRGMHLDVARHFFAVPFIKRFLDRMARLKMNRFHWHLTDDQGWRLDITRYPKLTATGGFRTETLQGHAQDRPRVYDRRPYGGFYTQTEIREVVEYARVRGIQVIPELEMPGHAQAALAAYPQLSCRQEQLQVATHWGIFSDVFCAGREETFEFLQHVLTEVVALFPAPWVHLGGDECPSERWEVCPDCQVRVLTEGLETTSALHGWFLGRMARWLAEHDRIMIGWDEILDSQVPKDAVVQVWQSAERGLQAVKQGHPVIMSPQSHCYFDHYQIDPASEPLSIGGLTPLEKVYDFDPVPKSLPDVEVPLILGAQGNVWTEYMQSEARVEVMSFNRMAALAEVLWTAPEQRDADELSQRIEFFNTNNGHDMEPLS